MWKQLLFLLKSNFKTNMKTLKLVLGIALFSVVLWSCKNEPETKTVEVEETKLVNEIDANATIAKAEFKIDGMTCAIGCAKTIEKKLSKMEGVKSATVNFEKEMAMVEYDEAKVNTDALVETVSGASKQYKVSEMKTVESFSTNFAKKGEPTSMQDKTMKKECANKNTAAFKEGSKKSCDYKKGDKASMGANHGGKMMSCKDDCDKACCADKA